MVGRMVLAGVVAVAALVSPAWSQARESEPLASDTAAEDPLFAEPMRVSMEFQDANLKDVLKAFSQQTGINVITGGELGAEPVTLFLEEVTVIDALDQILRASNLTYERAPGSEIYIVKPKADADAPPTVTRVYRLKYARVSKSVLARAAAAFAAKTPFEADLESEEGGGSGGSSGGSGSGSGGSGGAGGGTNTTVGIDEIVKELLTKSGIVVVDGRTNSLIVTDVAENFPRIEAALAALDVRTAQIMVDAELIETTHTKSKDFGIEWGTGTEGQLITFTPTSRTTRFPFGSFERIAPTAGSRFTAATLDASSFKAVLQAIESDKDSKILARPKVLTLDNESAVIRLTSDEAIGFQTTSQADTGTETAEPERATTGVVLVVTPQVNEQGYITMVVEPSVTKTVASNITAPSGQADPRDPKTRSSRTMVRIRSGDTLVVGGLIDRSDEDTVTKVPVLSGIPVLGEAFKNYEKSDIASELIVFVTPLILDEAPGAQVAAQPGGFGLREQEPVTGRQQSIERALNTFQPN